MWEVEERNWRNFGCEVEEHPRQAGQGIGVLERRATPPNSR
jgi:hypothetical protein